MNKKILALLLVLIAVMSVATVSAVELTKSYDFDGNFTMKIADSDKVISDLEDGVEEIGHALVSQAVWTINENVSVYYYTDTIDQVVENLNHNTIYLNKPTEEGNFTILEDKTYDGTDEEGESSAFKYFVGVSSGDKTVFVGCDDLNTAKEYAKTVAFTEA